MTPNLNPLIGMIQMRGHNICFCAELTKIIPYYSVSARVHFLRFDPVKSSVDATEVSQCVSCDATKLPPLKCLKNPVNTHLSVKCSWDISVLKYLHRYYMITPDNAIFRAFSLTEYAPIYRRLRIKMADCLI